MTDVDVVSCRTDLFPLYAKRGHREMRVARMEEEDKGEFITVTREGLSVVYMKKYNW